MLPGKLREIIAGKPKQYLVAVPEDEKLSVHTVEEHHLWCITDKPPPSVVWFGQKSEKAAWVRTIPAPQVELRSHMLMHEHGMCHVSATFI